MISFLLATCIMVQDGQATQGQEPAKVNPSQLISTMLGRYHAAETVTGSIMMSQSAQSNNTTLNRTLKIRTRLQFQKPALVFVEQIPENKSERYVISSNGKYFSYTPHETVITKRPGDLLVEPVVDKRGRSQDYRSIFAIGLTSLLDKNAPIQIAFGITDHLKLLRDQWATVQYVREDKIGEQTVHIVGGKWRGKASDPATGNYTMAITPEGDLKRFAHEEILRHGDGQQAFDLLITTVWDVDLKLNGTPDPALFKLLLR